MADEDDQFAIKVTAEISDASKAFNELLGVIDNAANRAGEALGRFDAALTRGSGGLLQIVSAIHPVGRTVAALVETLDIAVSSGRKLAEVFDAKDTFKAFEGSLEELKTAVAGTFEYLASQGGSQFGSVVSAAIIGDADAISAAITKLTETATAAVRNLQAAVESFRPEADRSTTALETRLAQQTAERDRLQREIEEFRRLGITGTQNFRTGEIISIEDMKKNVDEVEREMARLRAILESRIDPPVAPPDFSASAENILDAIRRQTRELEINAATFGMAAGAAARYRAELQLIEQFSDEDGPRGPLWDQYQARIKQFLDGLAAARQRMTDLQTSQRTGQGFERVFGGSETRIDQLDAQAEAVGRAAAETAQLTEYERILGQLRAQRIPIDSETEQAAWRQAEAYGRATEQLRTLQRQMQQIEAIGAVFSRSIEKAFGDWLSGTETNWRQLVNTMARDIAMLAIRSAILQPLFGGGGQSGGGWFGTLVSSLFNAPAPRASGGPMTAGMPYLVGEMGPELVIPGHDGTVVPNHALGGGATINMRIDLAGANGDETIARIAARAASAAAVQAVEASNEAFPARQRRLQVQGH